MTPPVSETELDALLSEPDPALEAFVSRIRPPLVILGAGGKMGPTLCLLARRAADAAGLPLPIIAVSRFGSPEPRAWLDAHGIETRSCDLFDRDAVAQLPDAGDVLYLVGQKFGTSRDPASTWAANAIPPGLIAERYPGSRLVVLSTGNVYPLVPTTGNGATETTPLTPIGEYPNAAVARERLFEFHTRQHHTPLVILRLNYAVELRYGVLHDIASRIWQGAAIDLGHGWFNCLWQGDANRRILRALDLAAQPPQVLNLTGPDRLSVRDLATRLGALLERPVRFTGTEGSTALLSDATLASQAFGPPTMPIDTLLRWTADWVRRGGRSLNKPTHFEVRDGSY